MEGLSEMDLKRIAKETWSWEQRSDTMASVFAKFIKKRFPDEFDEGYVREWAKRFAKNSEFDAGDPETRKALLKSYADVYGVQINKLKEVV